MVLLLITEGFPRAPSFNINEMILIQSSHLPVLIVRFASVVLWLFSWQRSRKTALSRARQPLVHRPPPPPSICDSLLNWGKENASFGIHPFLSMRFGSWNIHLWKFCRRASINKLCFLGPFWNSSRGRGQTLFKWGLFSINLCQHHWWRTFNVGTWALGVPRGSSVGRKGDPKTHSGTDIKCQHHRQVPAASFSTRGWDHLSQTLSGEWSGVTRRLDGW